MSDEGFEEVNILRKDAPDIVFSGKLIAYADNKEEQEQNAKRSSDRWTELAVYQLEGGDWVACALACSDKPGEVDFGDATIIPANDPHAAMTFFEWTWLAKKLAHRAGWDVREQLL